MYRKLDRLLVGIGSFTYDILSGGSANVIEYDVQRLVEAIYEQKAASLMTIDGSTAVGKTRLSKFLAARLNRVPRDLDDYLLGDGRPYALQIDYEKLKRDLMQAPSILSGICMLHVLKRAGLESNVPIYLVRTDENNRQEFQIASSSSLLNAKKVQNCLPIAE